MAFHVLDMDRDGLISAAEAHKMVAFYLTLQDHSPSAAAAAARPLSWDQHLLASISTARKLAGERWAGLAEAAEAYAAAKLAGGLQVSPPRASDLVWAGLGSGLAMLLLGGLATAVRSWPVVGQWHQQGLPLLLGSFGTFAILLFGKPEAEPARLWPLLGGQLGATAIALGFIKLFGANLLSRAAAMAATVVYMMWSDTIHPPGGALVLIAMGESSIQQFGWLYMLWPSLVLCLGVMLPISAATNWLRRNRQFDWPGSGTAAAASLHRKQQEWQNQQQQRQKKDVLLQRHAAAMLTDRLLQPGQKELNSNFVSALQRMLDAQAARQAQQQQQQASRPHVDDSVRLAMEDLRQRMITPQPRSPESSSGGAAPAEQLQIEGQQQHEAHADSSTKCSDSSAGSSSASSASNSSSSSSAWVPPTSPKLEEAARRRLRREADRKLEDDAHRQALWGACLPGLETFERRLQRLHEERLRRQHQQPAQQHAAGVLGAWALGLCAALGSSSFDEGQRQQQQGEAVQAGERPAWMYRWRSDISTVPGVGDRVLVTDSFAPDE
ncbi:HPP family-domain-containing protein [Scenedesmus sp. NREL 46B-D3]|nr:HPP family-domain-containing protein [Scenedesmus sp. NREL 46B-D3]